MDIQEILKWVKEHFNLDPWGAISVFIIIFLALISFLVFLVRKIWGRIMFRWRNTTHIGILGIYYRELPTIEDEHGNLHYELFPGLHTPKIVMSGEMGVKFLIVKLDIINRDDAIDNLLMDCKAQITRPKDIKTEIVPLHRAYVHKEDLKELYILEQDFENLIEDLSFPLRLKPGTTYTKHLCLELAYGSELIDRCRVEIIITDRYGKKSKIKKNFSIKNGVAFLN